MNHLRMFTFILILALLTLNQTIAQNPFNLDLFEIFQVEHSVKIDLILSKGNTCEGIYYYRSLDGENFKLIGQVNGTCGSPYYPVGYEFYDSDPHLNQVNYYAVDFGGFGLSRTHKIMVWDGRSNQTRVVPNPIRDHAIIFFPNPNEQHHHLKIFNGMGVPVLEHFTNTDQFEIETDVLPAGQYHYIIQSGESTLESISGSFIKN